MSVKDRQTIERALETWAGLDEREDRDAVAAVIKLAERNQRKAEAFHIATGYFSIGFTCENAHHEKKDQDHGFGDDKCPVVQRWRKARAHAEGESDE